MSVYDNLLVPENLYYAWKKARWLFWTADGYVDQAEIAAFELDLERQLESIHEEFEAAEYVLRALRPTPRPKKMKDGVPVNRQYFHVSVRDQVAWIAVVNALGSILDEQMPPWSYGNRIYRVAWYDKTTDGSKLERGPYRHQSGHLYRKFQHSWPLFRRHVSLTARAMVRNSNQPMNGDLDEADQKAMATAEVEKLAYLAPAYWQTLRPGKSKTLFHAGIDLEKFYPRLRRSAVLEGLLHALKTEETDQKLRKLLSSMLDFQVKFDGMPKALLENVEPTFSAEDTDGIPTGLFVSGFLCNAAMLRVDLTVKANLEKRRNIAHFRFVDDHVILAYNFDELCDWIEEYQRILDDHNIGVHINTEKYDPETLSRYIEAKNNTSADRDNIEALKLAATADTEIDGTNPTRLLTKTLAQVSEIAHTNTDLLDDDDLRERLKLLEWLLLADIPEREIRPDTRAAFAAGQIATTAPALIQEGDGLVAEARKLAEFRSSTPPPSAKSVREKEGELSNKLRDHNAAENAYLRRYFLLLLQAFKEFPNKARLFYRLLQYCRITGYPGIGEIGAWIKSVRDNGNTVWADYYAGLSHQILSNTVLTATRTLVSPDSLRSDRRAALFHLIDVAGIDLRSHIVPSSRRSWYQNAAQEELGISLLSAAAEIATLGTSDRLVAKLRRKAYALTSVRTNASSSQWQSGTGFSSGVWAHRVENLLSIGGQPSTAWRREFLPTFNPLDDADVRSSRRYPETFSDDGWRQELTATTKSDISDAGLFREIIAEKPQRIYAALASHRVAILRAAKSYQRPDIGWMTVAEWVDFLAACKPFDPRNSEWTALELTRQLVELTTNIRVDVASLDRVHEHNILVSERLKTPEYEGTLGWEAWQKICTEPTAVRFKPEENSVTDYRYYYYAGSKLQANLWERRLTAVGRLLLGLLLRKFDPPKSWNVRGLERVDSISQGKLFQSLAISSPTLLILNGCLSGRSAENREIANHWDLFGWERGQQTNDSEFDPPPLTGPKALLNALENAQRILKRNQLAVALNQPRQLIPFRLKDFSAGANTAQEDQVDGQ